MNENNPALVESLQDMISYLRSQAGQIPQVEHSSAGGYICLVGNGMRTCGLYPIDKLSRRKFCDFLYDQFVKDSEKR